MSLPFRFVVGLFGMTLCLSAALAGEGVSVSRPGLLRVNLATAVQMALAKNFTIQVQQYEPQIAEERVTTEWGIFDPVFTLGGSRDVDTTRGRLTAEGLRQEATLRDQRDVLFEGTVNGKTPLGTEYRFGLSSINNRTNGRAFDEFSTGPVASIAQPLLRGLGTNATMAGIRIAQTNVAISEWALKSRVIDVITDLVYTYNELHFSGLNLEVAIRSRELARQLLQDNTRRADIGVMSPLDITTARAEVAAREEGVILAQRMRADNEVVLKQLVTSDLEPMLGIQVEIDPPPSSDSSVEVHAGIRDALDLRPDYRSLLLTLQNRHVQVAFAKNAALPQLDLDASLGFLGFDSSFANSIGRVSSGDALSWSAGATFSIPFGNHAARGDLNAARLQAAQVLLDLKRLEQQIVVDVEVAAGQVVSDRARIASTTEANRLALESLNAGEQRLKAGTGTTFEVLELQKKLAEAESAELRARSDHNKAIAEFYRKTGRTLLHHHVQLN